MDNARHPFRHPRTRHALSFLLLGLAAAAVLAPQTRAALPAALPGWTPWIALGLVGVLALLASRRHFLRVGADAVEMRSASGRERIALSAIRRVELARFTGRYDVYLMLKGGGVRRVAARDLDDPDGVVAALGAKGLPIIRL